MTMKEPAIEKTENRNAINISFQVFVTLRKERNIFYIGCDALDVHSQGYTEEEAKANIIEAIQLFLESCFDRGVLTEALKELGFERLRREQVNTVHNELEDSGSLMIDVPLHLLIAEHVQQAQAH